MSLNTKPARTDLTDRECTKIIGGLLGGLMEMADLDTLRAAVRWWADSDQSWEMLAKWQHALRNPPTMQPLNKSTN